MSGINHVPLCLGDGMSDEVSILGAIELDPANHCNSRGGGGRVVVVRCADELAALLGDLKADAFDCNLIFRSCHGRVRGSRQYAASILLYVGQETILLHLLFLQALLALCLFDRRGSSLRILLKYRGINELQVSVGPADPGSIGIRVCARIGAWLSALSIQHEGLVAIRRRMTTGSAITATARVRRRSVSSSGVGRRCVRR